MQMKRRIVEIIVVSALVSGLMLPFLGKPFHSDDVFYIEITKAVVQDPCRPYSFMINWGWDGIPASGFKDFNPPLFNYLLAPVWKKWGASEVPLHLAALLFVFSAVLSFYFLCSEIGIKPFIPTLVFLSVPFFAVGTNLMLDTPVLGLAIPSVLFFVMGVKREKLWPLILSGVMFSLAVLTKYSALALLMPFFIYPFLSKKFRHIIPFAIGLAVFLIWNLYCFYAYGEPHFMNSHVDDPLSLYALFFFNLLALVMVIGMTIPYAALIIRRGVAFYFSLMCGMDTGIIYYLIDRGMESLINGILVGAGVFLGFYLLIYISGHLELKKKGRYFAVMNDHFFVFMILWTAMVVIMNLFFTPFIALRNIIFMYPALIIILFKYTLLPKIAAKKMYIVIGCMLVVHVALAYADFRYARSYKNAAGHLKQTYHNRTVWYFGHWGWQYYADAAGFKQWSRLNARTAKGDIVILPQNIPNQKMTDELKGKLVKIDSLTDELVWLPIRSQGKLSHAGFYGSAITRPAYTLSFKPLEVFDIYEVVQ
jgi:hypothetical protein